MAGAEKPPQGGFFFPQRRSRFVRTVYVARAVAFAFCFAAIGVLSWQRGAGAGTWVFLALTFLAYPHLAYLYARSAPDPRRAEQLNLLFDALLLGVWAAELGFPLWITYALLSGTVLNNLVNRGLRALLPSLALFGAGAAAWGAMRGFQFQPDTGPLVTSLGFLGSLAYVCAVGAIVHRQTQRVVLAREELRMSEERYRLIAENAGDLIALVDAEGRWRYVSPSYARMLPPADVLIGTDAFRCVHPEDAARARSALHRMLETGTDAQFNARMIGADGQVRVLETAGHPVRDAGGVWSRVVLVSRDVTELQASREQLEVAALAFANMTEAIMITAADGRVVSVNKAFCRITGLQASEVVGQPEAQYRFAMQPATYYDEMYAEVARHGHWAGNTWSRRKDGSVYREWRTVSAVRDEQERIAYHVAVFFEMDADKRFAGAGA
ncbi:MAG: PAS domain S-box protein [Proteobacteria bacterium]|nr:PAS domain S-box protein [Pseudomonadota bacterium]